MKKSVIEEVAEIPARTIEGAIETTYQTKWAIENGIVSVDIIHSAPITKVVTNSGGQLFPTGVEIDETEEEETN